MIFLTGMSQSLQAILDVFARFYEISGLKLNPAKTGFYCGGKTTDEAREMAQLSCYKLGQLAVHYLGVPLVSGQPTDKDCKPLIEKVTCRSDGSQM